ncbi:MAG: MFS transporter [archaeon GB-1867-035]|nr:MFS transporter [Candidatus Culexmicrobium profundum]
MSEQDLNVIGILIATWIIYASFYLCRVNFSIALPLINLELGIPHSQLGAIASGFFIIYATGQILNGYLSMKFKPQKMVLIGVIGSGIMTILFSLNKNFTSLLLIWMLNGYFQSLGWPTLVKVVAIISRGKKLGVLFGLFNTSWAIGHAISWLFTGIVVSSMNWRNGFTLNGLLFLAIAIPASIYLIERMKELNGKHTSTRNELKKNIKRETIGMHVKLIFLLATSFFIIDSIRYGLTVYLPAYIFSIEKSTLSSTFIALTFPITGSLGMITTGIISDKIKIEKKTLFVLTMSLTTMILTYSFPFIYQSNREIGIIALIILSALLYSIESQITAVIPIKIVGEKHSSITAGIINSIGAIGAFTSSIISGFLVDIYSFIEVFKFWSYIQIPLIPLLMIAYLVVKNLATLK